MNTTSGYVEGKVWRNGELVEDVEIMAEANQDNIELIIRNKDNMGFLETTQGELLRALSGLSPSSHTLDERLEMMFSDARSDKTKSAKCKQSRRKKQTKHKVRKIARRRRTQKKTKSRTQKGITCAKPKVRVTRGRGKRCSVSVTV